MVSVVKSEWHQIEVRYGAVIDADVLAEIYPDNSEEEISAMLAELECGNLDIDTVIEDAYEADVEIQWDHLNQDDMWTDRKGGYEVTYNVEEWEYNEPYKAPVTHKCTHCRWTGSKYDAATVYLREDGTVIDNYWDTDEDSHSTKDVCPMCDSDLALTDVGREEQEKHARLLKELEEMRLDEDDN